jgi:hypothetical protein
MGLIGSAGYGLQLGDVDLVGHAYGVDLYPCRLGKVSLCLGLIGIDVRLPIGDDDAQVGNAGPGAVTRCKHLSSDGMQCPGYVGLSSIDLQALYLVRQ